jgi:hypothetical protein
MAAILTWLDQNWFNLVQTLGIMLSTWLTGAALRQESRTRKSGNAFTLAQHHRELWSEVHRRPDLARILNPEVDLLAMPMTVAEEEFLNLVIEHFQTGWLMAQSDGFPTLQTLSKDARSFFALPLPEDVWQSTKKDRDPRFVQFINKARRRRKK